MKVVTDGDKLNIVKQELVSEAEGYLNGQLRVIKKFVKCASTTEAICDATAVIKCFSVCGAGNLCTMLGAFCDRNMVRVTQAEGVGKGALMGSTKEQTIKLKEYVDSKLDDLEWTPQGPVSPPVSGWMSQGTNQSWTTFTYEVPDGPKDVVTTHEGEKPDDVWPGKVSSVSYFDPEEGLMKKAKLKDVLNIDRESEPLAPVGADSYKMITENAEDQERSGHRRRPPAMGVKSRMGLMTMLTLMVLDPVGASAKCPLPDTDVELGAEFGMVGRLDSARLCGEKIRLELIYSKQTSCGCRRQLTKERNLFSHCRHLRTIYNHDSPCAMGCGEHGRRKYGVDTKEQHPSRFANCGGAACFPAMASVKTARGKKKLYDLEPGDSVMTLDSRGEMKMAQYLGNLHNETTSTRYLKIRTNGSFSLRISPKHLLPMYRNGEGKKLVFAESIKIGDELVTEKGRKKVRTISKTFARGKVAPLLDTGDVLIDGVLTSCFSDVAMNEETCKVVANMIGRYPLVLDVVDGGRKFVRSLPQLELVILGFICFLLRKSSICMWVVVIGTFVIVASTVRADDNFEDIEDLKNIIKGNGLIINTKEDRERFVNQQKLETILQGVLSALVSKVKRVAEKRAANTTKTHNSDFYEKIAKLEEELKTAHAEIGKAKEILKAIKNNSDVREAEEKADKGAGLDVDWMVDLGTAISTQCLLASLVMALW